MNNPHDKSIAEGQGVVKLFCFQRVLTLLNTELLFVELFPPNSRSLLSTTRRLALNLKSLRI